MIITANRDLKDDILHADNQYGEQVNDVVYEHKESEFTSITLLNGLIGFEEYIQYKFEKVEDAPLYTISNIPNSEVVFYLINPYFVRNDYVLDIHEEDYKLLGSPDYFDISVLTILTLNDTLENITCNLLGPVVLNTKNAKACQCINNGEWSTKHQLSNGKDVFY